MTTLRRFFCPPPPSAGRTGRAEASLWGVPPSPEGFAWGADCAAGSACGFGVAFLGAACFGAAGASALGAAFAVAGAPPFAASRALSATSSSTLDAAALASIPAALSAARTSLLVRPCAFAIS
jgi:hypothetical protein